jgi:hypothetical protein
MDGARGVCGKAGGGKGRELFNFGFGPGALGGEAAAGHDSAALAFMTPSGGELEGFFEIGVTRKFEGGEKGPLGGEIDAGFGVEEFGETAA